jgi:hypothetical protein
MLSSAAPACAGSGHLDVLSAMDLLADCKCLAVDALGVRVLADAFVQAGERRQRCGISHGLPRPLPLQLDELQSDWRRLAVLLSPTRTSIRRVNTISSDR